MSTTSTFALFARLIFSMGIVLGLMWIAARVLQRRGLGPVAKRQARAVELELLARKNVGRHASIAVVRAAGQAMVVGITEHEITKLADADLPAIDLEAEQDVAASEAASQGTAAPQQGFATPGQAWKAMLEHVREKTVRR
ncbi:MAG TPA: flagellar biosynthetic protein FliO [Acidimicrobiia bacterium]|nr:flagellar biosynthetic protein FliO [Acidimicrobiia bacterium]